MSADDFLPPGVTDRQIAEEGTHDLERCALCGALFFAAKLDENRLCPVCVEPDADMGRMEHDDRGDN